MFRTCCSLSPLGEGMGDELLEELLSTGAQLLLRLLTEDQLVIWTFGRPWGDVHRVLKA